MGVILVIGRGGSTMGAEEPGRTTKGRHDSAAVAAATAVFTNHVVRRLDTAQAPMDTAQAPIAATTGKSSVMAASSIGGSRGGSVMASSSVPATASKSYSDGSQLQQHGSIIFSFLSLCVSSC